MAFVELLTVGLWFLGYYVPKPIGRLTKLADGISFLFMAVSLVFGVLL